MEKTMKKSAQLTINNTVISAYEKWSFDREPITSSHRLNYCNAYVLDTANYLVLRSYQTDIAIIDKRTGIMYDFLRFVYGYTATSAQHIAKFERLYEPSARFTYYPVY